jgi:hypothetical protein
VRAAVIAHKKGAGPRPRDRLLSMASCSRQYAPGREGPTGAAVARGSCSLAQRPGAALVLRPQLDRPQRPKAGPAVEAGPEVALQSAKLSDADHAACRLGKQRREARAFFARFDRGCPMAKRPAALGQAPVDLRVGPRG